MFARKSMHAKIEVGVGDSTTMEQELYMALRRRVWTI
jgi:hypothetical protein